MIEDGSIFQRLDRSGVPLLLARLFIGVMFVYMGTMKVLDPMDFLRQVRAYELLPETPAVFINSTAIVLPWLEVICGIALVLGVFVRGAAAQIALMLVVFTPAILRRALAILSAEGTPFFEIKFDCGCGTGEQIIWQKLLTNTGLFLVTLLPLLSRSRRFCLALWYHRRRPHSTYCHRCGYAVARAEQELCGRCAGLSVLPVGQTDAMG